MRRRTYLATLAALTAGCMQGTPSANPSPIGESPSRSTFEGPGRRWHVELPDPLVPYRITADRERVVLLAVSANRASRLTPENATSDPRASPTPTVGPDETPRPLGTIVSLWASDGGVRWRERPAASILHPPILHDGRVHTVIGRQGPFSGVNTRVVAYDGDGGRRWTADRGSGSLSIVATDDARLYVGTHDDALGSTGETLFAVENDGTVTWEREAGDAHRAMRTGRWLLYEAGGSIASYDPADGSRRWKVPEEPIDEYSRERITLLGGRLFTEDASNEAVVARSLADGSELWRYSDPPGVGRRFVPVDITAIPETRIEGVTGPLYAGLGYDGVVFALEADGTERWTADITGETPYGLSGGDAVYVSNREGTLFALDPTDGEERWRESFEGFPRVHPLSDGVLAVNAGPDTDEDELVLFSGDGRERWRHTSRKDLLTVRKTGDAVYAGATDGSVFAFGL